mgnify:CR=1 FL=1
MAEVTDFGSFKKRKEEKKAKEEEEGHYSESDKEMIDDLKDLFKTLPPEKRKDLFKINGEHARSILRKVRGQYTTEEYREAFLEGEKLSDKEITDKINGSSESDWGDNPAFYAALLHRAKQLELIKYF